MNKIQYLVTINLPDSFPDVRNQDGEEIDAKEFKEIVINEIREYLSSDYLDDSNIAEEIFDNLEEGHLDHCDNLDDYNITIQVKEVFENE